MFTLNLFSAIALIFEGYNQAVLGTVSETPDFIRMLGLISTVWLPIGPNWEDWPLHTIMELCGRGVPSEVSRATSSHLCP